jgi:hypothetical protein
LTGTVADALATSLKAAAAYNQGDKAPPVAVLWPDPERLWTRVVETLRSQVPILTLGDYDEATGTGPGVWVRSVLGGELRDKSDSTTPWIVWLPGVARDELRAVENAPAHLRSLAELQYRADWWTRRDRSAWTPASWLRSQDGLGIDLAGDHATREALTLALVEVFNLSVEELRRRGRIDADYVTSLVSRDEVRTLLRWLDDPKATRETLSEPEWQAFQAQCRKEFNVDLGKAGPLSVAELLGGSEGPWGRVWQRYEEAPSQYRNLPDVLRQAKTQLLQDPVHWPQDNEDAEEKLRASLTALKDLPPSTARDKVAALELEHGHRRSTVWGGLGQSPLAHALGHLVRLAEKTEALPHQDSVNNFASWHAREGYLVDEAAVAALAEVRHVDLVAVGVAVRALYFQWLDDANRRFQDAVRVGGYQPSVGLPLDEGDCAVFVDGLRFDVGASLRAALISRGLDVDLDHRLAPMPTVTSTGKAAVSPVGSHAEAGDEFELRLDGKQLSLHDALTKAGVSVLKPGETSGLSSRGWTEAANIDKTGHSLGLAVAERLAGQVSDIAGRVEELLGNGWKRVVVVTDHGWLLMPGGLNKQELPDSRTVIRKPRVARLKAGAKDGGYPVVPYTYDSAVSIASPHGSAAFVAGCVYEHGGLSLQECVTPILTVTAASSGASLSRIVDLSWAGLRCRVTVEAAPPGAAVDLRRSPGDESSSVTLKPKAVEGVDEGALLVGDDSLEGQDVYAVLVSDDGAILSQTATRVGG